MTEHRNLGLATELWISDLLSSAGIGNRHLRNGGADIVIDRTGVRLEVKGVTRNKDGYFRATLENTHQTLAHSDVLVVVCWTPAPVIYVFETRGIHTKRIALRPGGKGAHERARMSCELLVRYLS